MLENLSIVRKNIKNINIRIKPNGDVVVSAPKFLSQTYIDKIIQNKTAWILKKQEILRAQQKSHEKGTIFYLGKKYKVLNVVSKNEYIDMVDETIIIYSKEKLDGPQKEFFLDEWYKQKALKLFEGLVEKYEKVVDKKIEKLRIKKMRSRWGSCNHYKKYINLNLHLIKTPLESIEYVVLHELAHLIYPNHSRSFYDFIEKRMGDWRKRKRALESFRLAHM